MRRRNMANPTMKKSAKVESEVDVRNLALIQQLKELEYIWKSQEKSRTRRSRSSFDHLFQNSPRRLMSCLQHRKPALRINKCSSAVEEILMDRRAAIMSGRFKGRQLFAAAEISSDFSESCSFPVVEVALVKKATLGLVLIVLALVVLFCITCNGNNVEDFILLPT